jgi:hypothetical protein
LPAKYQLESDLAYLAYAPEKKKKKFYKIGTTAERSRHKDSWGIH